ncbi:hypothetical protein Tco_0401598, partial [Tanacetum coccineum]
MSSQIRYRSMLEKESCGGVGIVTRDSKIEGEIVMIPSCILLAVLKDCMKKEFGRLIAGVDTIAADLKDQKVTVVVDMDAVALVKKMVKVVGIVDRVGWSNGTTRTSTWKKKKKKDNKYEEKENRQEEKGEEIDDEE